MIYGFGLVGKAGAWHSMKYGLAGMAWYGLAGKEWCMVWPGAHMMYGMAWWSWHDICCYVLAGITWYMV